MEPDHLTTPRLQEWLRRTQTPLDLVALMTIWLTILPFTRAADTSGVTYWVIGRLLLSCLYGVDIAVRAHLSAAPRRYVVSHPVALAAVLIPTVRILFSIRLLGAMFRKGALGHFLFVALMLILNGVILVYFFEVDAPGANITTFGDSMWWAAVTVATVGYGDYYPITLGGRITAVSLMAVGLVTAAVITAQIASTFMDQAAVRRATLAATKAAGATGGATGAGPAPAAASPATAAPVAVAPAPSPAVPVAAGVSVAGGEPDESPEQIHRRLDRIEALLRERLADDGT
jgi:voltage-gated potassium channel